MRSDRSRSEDTTQQQLSYERAVATVRPRIRALEEIYLELKGQLDASYGRIAVVQAKLGSLQQTSE
jgi:prefoldin subunit 5